MKNITLSVPEETLREVRKIAAERETISVPVMALFYVARRHLVAGLTAGGVKG